MSRSSWVLGTHRRSPSCRPFAPTAMWLHWAPSHRGMQVLPTTSTCMLCVQSLYSPHF
ncbi:unnamed protein product [Symbiodinium microadriaticum]|nr:unnamed protein product [Symbiodinium microadriaticum]